MKVISHLLFFVSLVFPVAAFAVPEVDSLKLAQERFRSIINEIEELDNKMCNLEACDKNKSSIDYLAETLKDAKLDWKEYIDEYDILKKSYKECFNRLSELREKGNKFKQKEKIEQLHTDLKRNGTCLDSLLIVGSSYEKQKEGDSVKLVKEKAERVWNDIESLKNTEEFKSEESLGAEYEKLCKTRESIAKLSEKTSPKIGDILLKIAIAIASLSIITGIVGSFIRSYKMRKNVDDTPTFEL